MAYFIFQKLNGRDLKKVEDVLKEGDEVEVKLIEVDQRSGKLKLFKKSAFAASGKKTKE